MYAQINYSQKVGNGPYTIAEVGCFLTAFCNLLARFGEPIDPPTLNNEFNSKGTYLLAPDEGPGVRDNLSWGSVSAHDGQVVVTSIGSGWPASNDAIVKFVYISPRSGKQVTHFTLVQDHAAGTILDSFDGVVKHSPYGTPVAYATYERHIPQPVTPPPAPALPAFTVEHITPREEELKVDTHLWDLNQRTWPGLVNNPVGTGSQGTKFTTSAIAHHVLGGSYYMLDPNSAQGYNTVDCENAPEPAPQPVPSPEPVKLPAPQGAYTVPNGRKYNLVTRIDGYLTATQAGNHDKPKLKLEAGDYFVFNEYPNRPDLINVTKKDGTPGAWINTADNVPPPPVEPVPQPTPEPEPVVVPEPAPTLPEWQYHPFVNPNGMLAPVKYVALKPYTVIDLAGYGKPVQLNQYDYIIIGGTFKDKDGKIWGRPQDAVDHSTPTKQYYYGVPMDSTVIEPYDELFSTATTRADRRTLHTETVSDILQDGFDEVKKVFATIGKAVDIVKSTKKK